MTLRLLTEPLTPPPPAGVTVRVVNEQTGSRTAADENEAFRVFNFFRNEGLAGSAPANSRSVGFRTGTSIIKDKLFYFINAARKGTPRPACCRRIKATEASSRFPCLLLILK